MRLLIERVPTVVLQQSRSPMPTLATLRREWLANPRGDILAGIVVALALIPEAIGFSIIAGVDPRVGLYASFSIAVITALVGGRPGMISAATAAVAVLVVPLVRDHGLDYLFAATILMGVLQVLGGFIRLDLLMQYVSRSVVTGFVNALAILIFIAQLPQLTGVTWVTYAMVAAGLGVIYLFPRLTRSVPSPLVAIVLLTVAAIYGGLDVNTVGDMGKLPSSLPAFLFPNVPLTFETLRIILPYSATMAAVGLLESMLTAQIVDELTDTPSNKPQEMKGQGIANFATGFLGGMGGCAMIGEVWGLDPPFRFRGRHVPALPDRRPGSARGPDPDAGPGGRHDHGLDRHVQLALDQGHSPPSVAVFRGDGRHRVRGRLDARSRAGRARRRDPFRPLLREQGEAHLRGRFATVG